MMTESFLLNSNNSETIAANFQSDVTIAIPVYNEVDYIEEALGPIIGCGCKIIISDNHSEDGTSEICSAYAKKYNNILYTRRCTPPNGLKDAARNFLRCCHLSSTNYTMIMRGRDLIDQQSLEIYYNALKQNAELSHAFGKLLILSKDLKEVNELREYSGAEQLMDDAPHKRVLWFVQQMRNIVGTMWYGMYKTTALQSLLNYVYNGENIMGGDNLAMAKFLIEHKSIYLPNAMYVMRQIASKEAYMEKYYKYANLSEEGKKTPYNPLSFGLLSLFQTSLTLSSAEKKCFMENIKSELISQKRLIL